MKGSLNLFLEYSQLSKKYDPDSCKKKWKEYKKYNGDKLTFATLITMAKNDNPIEF